MQTETNALIIVNKHQRSCGITHEHMDSSIEHLSDFMLTMISPTLFSSPSFSSLSIVETIHLKEPIYP